MQSKATTVKAYLDELPSDRRKSISAIRKVIRKSLPKGYEEGMQYGMIGYYVPHKLYPPGYHCDPKQPLPFASIAAQKNNYSVYLFCVYIEPGMAKWFQSEWKKTGVKLDMGKSCVRFKDPAEAPIHLIGEVIKQIPVKDFIAYYESAFVAPRKTAKTKAPAKKTAKKATKKAVAKTPKKRATSPARKSVKKTTGATKKRKTS